MPPVVVFDEFAGPDVMHVVDEPAVEPAAGRGTGQDRGIRRQPARPDDAFRRLPGAHLPAHAQSRRRGNRRRRRAGLGVTGLEIGDPVILTAIPDASVRGSYAEYTTVPASRAIARPAGLAITEAAAIWVAYSTAYGALVEKAGMRPGDHVLITAASGGVGRAAMQIANQIGAVPIAVTRHTAKEDDLIAACAAPVIATDRMDVAEAVRRHTSGRRRHRPRPCHGPRPAGSPEGGPTRRNAGRRGLPAPPADALPGEHAAHDLPLSELRAHPRRHRGEAHGGLPERLRAPWRPATRHRPVFVLDDVAEAHRYLEKGLHAGKIVVTV